MRNYWFIFYLFIFFYGCLTLHAQKYEISVKFYGIEDGISQSIANHVMQDSKGYIWIGTQDGLNKYNGYEFMVYRHDPGDFFSLPGNYVWHILEDKDKEIWIATQIGLSRFNPLNGKFTNYYNNPSDKNTINQNLVTYIFQDSDGFLWIKTPNALNRLDKYSGKTERFDFYYDSTTYASNYNKFCIFEDSEYKLWVATKDGLNYFDRINKKFIIYKNEKINPASVSHNEIRTIYEDKQKNLWIGTQNGLNKFNRQTKTFERFYYKGNAKIKDENIIRALYVDSFNVFWVGTEKGLKIFDRDNGIITEHPIVSEKIKERVSSIMEDNSKILWIGNWNGVYKIDRRKPKFNTYKSVPGEYTFSSNYIGSIFMYNQDVLWFGSKNSGLNIFNRKTGTVTIFSEYTPSKYIPDNRVNAIYRDRNGKIWLGTNNGIVIYNEKEKSFVDIFSEKKIKKGTMFENNRISKFAEDFDNNMWIATFNGLYCITNTNKIIAYKKNPQNANSLSSDEIYDLIVSSDSTFWIATVDGLTHFDPAENIFKKYKNNPKQAHGLSNNSILSVIEDNDGIIWIGTESGLNRLDPKTDSIKYYTQKNGLANDYIYAIVEDKNKCLWISTNHGVSMFDKRTERFINYSTEDGLQSYEFNLGSKCISDSGEIFFGGINGVNSFFPDSITYNEYVPSVTIMKVAINDGKKNTSTIFDTSKPIELKYGDDFTIYFATLEYTLSEKNLYRYMMDGIDETWSGTTTQHFVKYSQLPPGSYTFKILGSNNDNVWNFTPTQVKIYIRAPFYKTTFAYFIYAILLVLLVYLVILYFTRQIRKENLILLEKEKASKEVELQREQLEIKNKSITDSINYAKKIIDAMLPSEKIFKRLLPESFILYMPKDIVSGDFFWISQFNGKIFIAAVDCTGHGVPGAFMSIIGLELFRTIISEGIEEPARILNKLNDEVANIFRKEGEEHLVKDGMDLSFVTIDKENQILQFAGAFNSIFIIRNNNIIELKADRFSVGLVSKNENQSFQNQQIELEPDDTIYMFSDGYADQFGGQTGKKFKYRRFRHLLLNLQHLKMSEQRETLYNTIEKWRGDFEQIDDILIIGYKPLG